MMLSVPLTPDIEEKLRERANCAGKAPEAYAAEVLARDVTRPTLDEILAPIREDFARTGMSDDEIMEVGRRELEALRAERDANSE
jgi:hypothetical protein